MWIKSAPSCHKHRNQPSRQLLCGWLRARDALCVEAPFVSRCAERRSKEDLSEDDDAILKRMFADPKKRLSKHELPGLYKKAGAAAGGEAGRFLTRPPSKDVAPAPRALKRKALPGRLRKKLASQAERGP